jgi:hypothetical protein
MGIAPLIALFREARLRLSAAGAAVKRTEEVFAATLGAIFPLVPLKILLQQKEERYIRKGRGS